MAFGVRRVTDVGRAGRPNSTGSGKVFRVSRISRPWTPRSSSGEQHLGTAVTGLAFMCPSEVASPEIVRSMRVLDAVRREFAFTAAGTVGAAQW